MQELGHFLQLPQRFGLYRFDLVVILQHPLQLALPPPQRPDRGGVVQPHATLLNDFSSPNGIARPLPRLERQRYGVDRLARRIQQQARDIKRAQFMFEDRLPAFECQLPEPQPPAQGILVFVSADVIVSLSFLCHILLSVRAGASRARPL